MPPGPFCLFPSCLEDYSTKKHFGLMKKVIADTYHKRKIKPLAICEYISEVLFFDAATTFFRVLERYQRLEDKIRDFKYK
jgi:hypothetical protein